jgi:hypothetical protein
VLLYFTAYTYPQHHPSLSAALSAPLAAILFFAANVGAPLGGWNLAVSAAAGGYLLLLLAALVYGRLRSVRRGGERTPRGDITLASLVLFSLLASAVISVARAGFGYLDWAMNSRYVTITSLGVAGTYMLFLSSFTRERREGTDKGRRYSRLLLAALAVALVAGLATAQMHGLLRGIWVRANRLAMRYTLQTFEHQPDSALGVLYPSPELLRQRAVILKENGLSVFAERGPAPPDVLLLGAGGDPVPAGEILPDRPLVQAFECPVQTLHDVAIQFATYARQNSSHLQVTLAGDGGLLMSEELLSAEIEDNSWVPLVLPNPIEDCLGQDLVLSIESTDAWPGNAVTVWTHPRYYDGELLQPEELSLEERVVGLELNVSFYQL